MTESEWLTSDDATRMVCSLSGPADHRKSRLFVCACCRQYLECVSDANSAFALDAAERFADGLVTSDALNSAYQRASDPCIAELRNLGRDFIPDETDPRYSWWGGLCFRFAAAESAAPNPSPNLPTDEIIRWNEGYWNSLMQLLWDPHVMRRTASMLREFLGNPYRERPTVKSWLTPELNSLAERIYQERAFQRILELGEALKQAGCDDAELIEHFSTPIGHTLGCWGLDLVLGKSTSVTVPR